MNTVIAKQEQLKANAILSNIKKNFSNYVFFKNSTKIILPPAIFAIGIIPTNIKKMHRV